MKLTFGSDAHRLCEIGEFATHLAFLRSIGVPIDAGPIECLLGIESER
ncbi:MAG: hypothetical protein BWZ10_03363 [candidate division BRC1 bacterium ADurb.BinA364]|nr:MAG: hypothetical protein BWZ10_03363 [candidate division BRC1 bacterium ADurb.BinA364]